MAEYRNGQDSMTYAQLEEISGQPRDVWDQRIWGVLETRNLMFLRGTGNARDNGSCTSSYLHLPAEFPNGSMTADPFEKTRERGVTACRDHKVYVWQYKPISCYPVGYRNICSYCLYEFHRWWTKTDADVRSEPHDGCAHG